MNNTLKIILLVLLVFLLINFSCDEKENFSKKKKNRKKKRKIKKLKYKDGSTVIAQFKNGKLDGKYKMIK